MAVLALMVIPFKATLYSIQLIACARRHYSKST
jgi:hypothetical protein